MPIGCFTEHKKLESAAHSLSLEQDVLAEYLRLEIQQCFQGKEIEGGTERGMPTLPVSSNFVFVLYHRI